MLIEFSISNFRSFRNKVTLNLRASSITEFKEENTFCIGKNCYLHSAALYGANASGKSNLIKGLDFVRNFVINSARTMQTSDDITVTPFKLDPLASKLPCFFEILFSIQSNQYRYGFEVDQKKVVSEWLFFKKTSRESLMFVRNSEGIDVRPSFKEGRNLEEKTRDNALFLSVAAQFNGVVAMSILKWFKSLKILSGIDDARYFGVTLEALDDITRRPKIIEFLKLADLGIDDLAVTESPFSEASLPKDIPAALKEELLSKYTNAKTVEVSSLHKMTENGNKIDEKILFNFDTEESEGTKKFFHFAGPILNALADGSVLLIDELDTKLHPLLTRAIVLLFNSHKTNPKNAQLIFATHNTTLLSNDLLRRDQIWFIEKNKHGSSELYSLVEYKLARKNSKVRKDASFEKEYMRGRYGAIPCIENLEILFEDK